MSLLDKQYVWEQSIHIYMIQVTWFGSFSSFCPNFKHFTQNFSGK